MAVKSNIIIDVDACGAVPSGAMLRQDDLRSDPDGAAGHREVSVTIDGETRCRWRRGDDDVFKDP